MSAAQRGVLLASHCDKQQRAERGTASHEPAHLHRGAQWLPFRLIAVETNPRMFLRALVRRCANRL